MKEKELKKLKIENEALRTYIKYIENTKDEPKARESPLPKREQRQKEIMSITDTETRIKTIAQNLELFSN